MKFRNTETGKIYTVRRVTETLEGISKTFPFALRIDFSSGDYTIEKFISRAYMHRRWNEIGR